MLKFNKIRKGPELICTQFLVHYTTIIAYSSPKYMRVTYMFVIGLIPVWYAGYPPRFGYFFLSGPKDRSMTGTPAR